MSEILSSHPWISQQDTNTIENIVKKIDEYELTEQKVVDWFSNFSSPKQYQLALKIFFLIDFRTNKKSIDAIKIYKQQINQSMFKLDRNNIILISSNKHDDSSNRFIYDIAKNWELTDSNIYRKSELSDDLINDTNNFFIFFNDTHGTGNQFATEFKDIITSINEKNCAIISITMTDTAINRFEEEFPNIALVQPNFQSTKNIHSHHDENSLTSADIVLLEQLGNDVYSKGMLGYKNSGLLIAYSHQCPNNTLPIIWANGKNNEIDEKAYPWNPLFEYKKIKQKKIIKTEQIDEKYLTTLPPKNPDFIGRVNELQEVKKNLEDNKLIYIVNGIGGVGKSELSYEYFHQHKEQYKKTAFIELSDDKLSLEEIFLIKFKEKFQVDSFDAIINRLQEYPERNLFLIDNLERREDFEKLKVLNTNFDLLITSRITDIDTNHQLNLETLLREDARTLFLSIYKTEEDIEDILDYLDNHPLFINLGAKSLLRNYITLDELRDDIKNNNVSKIQSKDSKTFQVHLEKIFEKQFQKEGDKELKILLQKLSIFPSVEIGFEVYERLLNVEKKQLQMLVDKGWLIHKENQYKLHQIIKTFIWSSYKPDYKDIVSIFENLANFIDPYDSTLIANLLNHYIPIIESFLNLYESKQDIYKSGILDSLTYLYYSLANYEKALNIQNESKIIKENIKDLDKTHIAKSYSILGIIYRGKGDYAEALEWGIKALNIKEKVLGTNHPYTAIVYTNIGLAYDLQGKYDKALEWFDRALKITEHILGFNHPDTATTYGCIASVYYSQRKYDKALEWYKKSLDIKEQVLVFNHPHIAATYNNIGLVYNSQRKYGKALECYEKSLDIKEQVLEFNHPDIATTYNNIGLVYDSQRKYDKAFKWYEKSLNIKEQVLGFNHPLTATTYNNIAYAYKAQKFCAKAIEFFNKSLNIYNKTDYNQNEVRDITQNIKDIEKLKKQEKKAKFKDKGRYCKD